MSSETKQCQNCKVNFLIEPEDFNFYERLSVPPPTWCPECRLIRRFMWRNHRALYKRKCDLCGEEKIFMYPAESPYKVYCHPCWWSDRWSALDYGREYDFSKPFFEQFRELFLAVPRLGVIKQGMSVESEYTNRVTDSRNCYLMFATSVAEYCRYGEWLNNSKECTDCYSTQKSTRCYECIDCFQCYNVAFSQESNSCSDSWFLVNCVNCQNCFGCVNLRNKQYHIFNKSYSKEEYQKIISGYQLGSALFIEEMRARFDEFRKNLIMPALVTHHSTNVSGNWIEYSKNLRSAFGCAGVEDGSCLFSIFDGVKDVGDYTFWGRTAERIHEVVSGGIQIGNVQFGNECWNEVHDMQYVSNCHSSHDLFGCIGVKQGEYCILNKRYDRESFEKLKARIIEQMDAVPYADARGRVYRYGEFFPPEFSPFAYNETIAQEFFPIDKQIAEERGYRWRNPDTKNYKITLDSATVPDNVKDAVDSITDEIIGCAHGGACKDQCTAAFRVTAEDLTMYRRANLPLPRLCPNCRHFERLKRRTPIKLWPRKCQCVGTASANGHYQNTNSIHPTHTNGGACPNEFETSYAPDRPEIVYCLECYNAEVV